MSSIMKKMAPVVLASVFMLPLAAGAEVKSGSVEVTPFAGYTFFDKQQNLRDQPLVGGRLGYNITNHIGVEGTWDFMRSYVYDKSPKPYRQGEFAIPMNKVNITQFNLGLLYHFMPEGVFNPYLVAGYGVNHYAPMINNKNMSVLDFGLGAKYWMAEHVALRVDARDNMIFDEHLHNIETTLGVVVAFGGKSAKTFAPIDSDGDGVVDTLDKCPGTPSGVAVDKDGCPRDSDGDGVPDYLDKCPGTPAGVAVDKDGCPLDSDKDGVANNLDKCPGTPAGVAVDKDGCPLDSDKDGVPDYLDKCPGTPAGVAVDKDGCPPDSDGDGVPNNLDKCPGTPAGVAVDKDGCPLDSDGDGVPDYLDKCPGTPAGVAVDANGCPPEVVPAHVKAAAAKRFCSKPVVLEIHFDTDKSNIKPEYHDELKTVGDFLMYFPNAKGEISGHTDSIASYEYNQKLSERRAESVERYISKTFGINPGRIATKGYGETKPVASNMEKAGRAKNRRIEANFTCE
jgi:OOP family OmpA-OmpF porin